MNYPEMLILVTREIRILLNILKHVLYLKILNIIHLLMIRRHTNNRNYNNEKSNDISSTLYISLSNINQYIFSGRLLIKKRVY